MLCGGNDVLQGVESLVEKSLLLQEPRLGGEPRYWMLETIREYASGRLQQCGQGDAARGAHAAYFRALAERAEAEYFGWLDREWLDRLEQEYANMLAAIDWSLAGGEPEVGLALASALWRFFYHRDHLTAGRDLLRRLLAAAAPSGTAAAQSPTLAKGLFAAASLAVWQGESGARPGHAEASVAMWRTLGDKRGEAEALHTLAHTAMDHAAERDLYTASVSRFREMDDRVAWPGHSSAWGTSWSCLAISISAGNLRGNAGCGSAGREPGLHQRRPDRAGRPRGAAKRPRPCL